MKYHNIPFSKRCINALGSIQSHFRPISEEVWWPKGLWSNISDSVKNVAKTLKSVSGKCQFCRILEKEKKISAGKLLNFIILSGGNNFLSGLFSRQE